MQIIWNRFSHWCRTAHTWLYAHCLAINYFYYTLILIYILKELIADFNYATRILKIVSAWIVVLKIDTQNELA